MSAPDPRPLATILLAHASGPLVATDAPADLEPMLEEIVARCQRAWPDLTLPVPAFVRHLAERLQGASLTAALSAANAEDLYLACACAQGIPGALAAFDQRILLQVPAFLASQRPSPTLIDEVRQHLRERLLVGSAEVAPRIAEYSGRGSLIGWVRIAAVRTALNMGRNMDDRVARKEQEDPALLLRPDDDPEMEYLKRRYQRDFKAAVQDALASLSADQRTFLRLHLIEGLSCEQIGALFKMSRSTVQRRVTEAREAVHKKMQKLMQERLRLSPPDVESLARLVRSQFNVSLARCLAEDVD